MTTRFKHFLVEKQLLLEHYVNCFTLEQKRKYMQEVWDILQTSYAYIGGIKGEEFTSPEAMLNVPFWKVCVKNGKVIMVRMYKDHYGRKSVAGGTDGSVVGKAAYSMTMKADLKVSYSEVSGAAEAFLKKNFPDLYNTYRIKASEVSAIIKKDVDLIDGDEYHYKRNLGGEKVVKILLGTPGKKFYGDALLSY